MKKPALRPSAPGAAPPNARVQAVFGLLCRREWDAALRGAEALVSQFPRSADAWNVLALAAAGRGELTLATDLYRRALALDPAFAQAHNNLGAALTGLGRVDEGLACFRRALQLAPRDLSALDNLLLASHCASSLTPVEVADLHRAWGRLVERQIAPQDARRDRPPAAPLAGRPLRVGYVSADFKQHSVAWFLEPVLAHHDRDRFHVTAYANVERPDEVTARLRGLVSRWRDVAGLEDAALARQIAVDAIDVLVDLSGHTAGHRLATFARRPAPVQVTWLGYPGTTGLSRVDFRVTDARADPQGLTDALHTETLLRLPRGFLCYGAPSVAVPPRAPSPEVTFGCFNDLAKIGEPVIDAWARLLAAVPGARLLLKARALADGGARQRLEAAFAARGIVGARIATLGFRAGLAEHLETYAHVDVALDTFPYNGTTTTCEALWMGVPVVTLAGASHASRVGASLLATVGMEDAITGDAAGYVATAAALAGNPARRAALRGGMRARLGASPLLDAAGFTRALEEAYVEMARTKVG